MPGLCHSSSSDRFFDAELVVVVVVPRRRLVLDAAAAATIFFLIRVRVRVRLRVHSFFLSLSMFDMSLFFSQEENQGVQKCQKNLPPKNNNKCPNAQKKKKNFRSG